MLWGMYRGREFIFIIKSAPLCVPTMWYSGFLYRCSGQSIAHSNPEYAIRQVTFDNIELITAYTRMREVSQYFKPPRCIIGLFLVEEYR